FFFVLSQALFVQKDKVDNQEDDDDDEAHRDRAVHDAAQDAVMPPPSPVRILTAHCRHSCSSQGLATKTTSCRMLAVASRGCRGQSSLQDAGQQPFCAVFPSAKKGFGSRTIPPWTVSPSSNAPRARRSSPSTSSPATRTSSSARSWRRCKPSCLATAAIPS